MSHPGRGGVRVVEQEVTRQSEPLSVCLYEGQRENPACGVKQGPGVLKAS